MIGIAGGKEFWIGGYSTSWTGNWAWADGSTFKFHHWANGYPTKGATSEQHIKISTDRMWYSIYSNHKSRKYAYICKCR